MFLLKDSSRGVERPQFSARLRKGPREEKLEDSSHGVRCACGNPTQEQTGSSSFACGNPWFYPSSGAWGNAVRSSEQESAESASHWQEVCHETKREGKKHHKESFFFEAIWKTFGKTALFATISPQKKVPMRSAMGHKNPGVQFILNAHAGNLAVLTAEADFLFEDDNWSHSKMGKWATSLVLRLCFAFGGTCDVNTAGNLKASG